LDAHVKLGEMLEGTEFTKGGRGKTGSRGGISLTDFGVDKKQSHYAQKVAWQDFP